MPELRGDRLPTDVYVDGEEVVVELRGFNKKVVHRPDREEAEDGDPWPDCANEPSGFDVGCTEREFRFRERWVAEDWRDGCNVCFPDGGDTDE